MFLIEYYLFKLFYDVCFEDLVGVDWLELMFFIFLERM